MSPPNVRKILASFSLVPNKNLAQISQYLEASLGEILG